MYSRSTDRGGRRIKLPPGYDGNAFRHDTGEVRRLGRETEMKIHSPSVQERYTEAVEKHSDGMGTGTAQGHRTVSGELDPAGHMGKGERQAADAGEETERFPDADAAAESAAEDGGKAASGELCPVRGGEPAVLRGNGSLLEGLLGSLGSEDWLLFLVILLLVADGSDAWDLILLLGVLLAVK